MFGTGRLWLAGFAFALSGGIALVSPLGPAGAQDGESLSAEGRLALERALADLNFDPGEVDGVIDQRTRTAIRLYQEFAALAPDGLATRALLAEVLSVAQSFAALRATRAAEQAAAQPARPAPPAPPAPPEAAPRAMRPEAVPEAVPEEVPEAVPEAMPETVTGAAERQAQAPEIEAPEVQVPETKAAPPEPAPAQAAAEGGDAKPSADGGFDIGRVISRLVENGEQADKPRNETLGAAPAAPAAPAGPARSARPAGVPGGGYGAFREAYRAAKAGEFETAIERYTGAIESDKLTLEHLADAHFNRANAFHYLGRFDRAIDDYGAAIGNKPTFAGAYYNRGFAHEAKGERRRAVDDFREARDLGLQRLGVRAPDIAPPMR